MKSVELKGGLTFCYVGPDLHEGPLPTLLYFALSARDSLETDPYNQPVQYLAGRRMRIFTVTLPEHEEGKRPEDAIPKWTDRLAAGDNFLPPFFKQVAEGIDHLFEMGAIESLVAAGLSRGGLLACHVAALEPRIKAILAFAPMTQLNESLDINHLAEALIDRKIRFYIGNNDTRVGTENAFAMIHALAKAGKEARIRDLPYELIISPSIGHQGHGTSPEIFKAGAEWVANEL